jgi:acetyl-CoA carboxylase carboxyl transferase subunit beta
MRLFSRDKPKIKVQTTKKDGFSGWIKCSECQELIHGNELAQNDNCCPKCDYHYRLSIHERLDNLADRNTFEELFGDICPRDTLKFADTESYGERLNKAREKTQRNEAAIVGTCQVNGRRVALGIMDFKFMGGSMGSVVGERLTLLIEYALHTKLPLIIVSASGGARMQESIFSLMQMAKTSGALAKLHEAKIPYISILTNPTSGGVTASFASLGDIIIAEPGALICFAGPRVIEQTISQKLPEGAQKAEFLLQHGMIDCIVKRRELKKKLAAMLNYVCDNEKSAAEDSQQQRATSNRKRELTLQPMAMRLAFSSGLKKT